MTSARYSQQEDDLILDFVSKFPGNLSIAFEQAALKIGRHAGSVSGHYYAALKNNTSRRATTALVTNKGVLTNTKNTPRNNAEDSLKALDVAKIASDLLTPAEKKALIHHMLTK